MIRASATRSIVALSLVVVATATSPRAQEGPFSARSVPANVDGGERLVVSAGGRAVSCLEALHHLGDVVHWDVRVGSAAVLEELQRCVVDLDFADQDPRMVGQLIAMVAGADALLAAGGSGADGRPVLHVTRTPDPGTVAGGAHARASATDWYRAFLAADVGAVPAAVPAAMHVRWELGRLLVEAGDPSAAIPLLGEVCARGGDAEFAAAATLLAEIELGLAAAAGAAAVASDHYAAAESWARRLLEHAPESPSAAGAVVALGRALLGRAGSSDDLAASRELCQACLVELSARGAGLTDADALLDVGLLTGHAQFLLELPDRVCETLAVLPGTARLEDLGQRRRLDYQFLVGYGALGTREAELAIGALEWFVANADADPRRGVANVLLAEAYQLAARPLQARAAAAVAREQLSPALQQRWRRRALWSWSRAALALGDADAVLDELRRLGEAERDPELVLSLVDALLVERRWTRSIAACRLLLDGAGGPADQARYRTVLALHGQATADGDLAALPAQARQVARQIVDPDLRGRCAELVGDVYTNLGRLEAAADAYWGILR